MTAIRSSYFIYTRRNKGWENRENLKILLIVLDDVLGMVGHRFTTVERNIPTFTCNTLCNCYFTCEQELYEVLKKMHYYYILLQVIFIQDKYFNILYIVINICPVKKSKEINKYE